MRTLKSRWFQFPSNGKVYCKHLSVRVRARVFQVSIPFKREGVLQAIPQTTYPKHYYVRFNSLQTGRCIASAIPKLEVNADLEFQFPSNGKVYCKKEKELARDAANKFQFPSNGKVYCK